MYWCGDDEGWFDDSGGDGFDGGDDGQNEDDEPEDEEQEEEEPEEGAGGGGGDDDDFNSDEDLPELDEDVFGSAEDFPNAVDADFEEDAGDWTPDDYSESAGRLFGDNPFFGDSLETKLADSGFQPFEDSAFGRAFDQIAPGTSENVRLFERDGHLSAFGIVSQAALALLMARYTGLDLSGLEVAVPPLGERVEPQPLPPAFSAVEQKDAVDLRKYATPVGDQRQTSRCSAFAWTHALELAHNVTGQQAARLSPTYTMLQFQRMQGDARDYAYAHRGGDGTVGGPDPGEVLVERGSCRQDLWPDDDDNPRARESQLDADAEQRRLEGKPWPVALEDVKKVLSAGCPVHVAMNTGRVFTEVGRDGLFNAAERPSGIHGRHAMLITGYTGNFFTVKNSWGTSWGDNGYCYIPRNVLAESNAEFVALLAKRQ